MPSYRSNEYLIIDVANYTVKTKSTIRQTAKRFNISKSTIALLLNKYLKEIDYNLYLEVRNILEFNKDERSLRGGRKLAELNFDSLHKDIINMIYYKEKEFEK